MKAMELAGRRETGKEAERIEEEMEKEAGGVVGVAVYRDGYEDLRKKEEKCNENRNEIEFEDGAGDDVCPICLDTLTNPCRSNCGHLFCGGCILQLWMYRYSIQPCKCPLCCCRIVNLELQTSEEAGYSSDVRKEVQHYNGVYISGLFGALHILPLLMGRVFRVLVDVDYLRCIMCVVGLFLGLLYERLEFEFIPPGVVYRWMLKRRARLLVVVDTSLRNVT
ncbi:E3 ubiquitin-protein ligase RNF170-like isoform X2 [Salvia splendens]|uniref:E3 ubiquitin-protein ligase RNF170-like isoform X2 n=1 Tax=Salvia splendens TaxID=180675 RepID=UPI001C2517A7|nr:E3 ubiquitin-protein ligase RNF170-like isoform X2 [Salvia splendens]